MFVQKAKKKKPCRLILEKIVFFLFADNNLILLQIETNYILT